MKRIDTPTAVPNLFGPGLAGFSDLAGVDGTEFDASFVNAGQETLCRAITGQNLLLDGANFDQLTDAINIWSTFNAISVAPGGTFTMVTASTFIVETGSTIQVDSGGTISALLGSTVNLLGNVTIGTTSANTLAVASTVTSVILASAGITGATGGNPVSLPEGATIPATKQLTLTGDAQVLGVAASKVTAGTIDTIDEGGRVKPGGVEFYTDTTPGATDGLVQWNGKRLSVGSEGAAVVIRHPIFDYVATESTAAAGTDITGLNITADVPPTQDVYITLEAHQSVDAANGSLLRIRATNGVDSVTQLKLGDDDAAVSDLPAQAFVNERRPNSVRVRWRPTDDFAVPDNDTWTFFAQHGVSGGDNLKTTAATLMLQFL